MKNRFITRNIVFGIVVLFLGAGVASAYTITTSSNPQPMNRGNTLYVGGSGPGNYTTIQEAVDAAANSGDTVFVYNNSYNENVDTKFKKITLLGEDRDTTIITAKTATAVIRIGTSETTVSGFTLIGTPPEAVIQVTTLCDSILIANNLIKDGGYGITFTPTTSKVTISNNSIKNNAFIGIQIQTSSYTVVKDNIIENNGAQGIDLSLGSHHVSILNNSIKNNAKEAISINGLTSKDNIISGNNLMGNQIGVRLSNTGSNKIQSNNIQDNTIEGVLMQFSKENVFENNNFINNKRQAAFQLSSRNIWDGNYWSNWIGFKLSQPIFQNFPKVIFGLLLINIDRNPAKLPYNISMAL